MLNAITSTLITIGWLGIVLGILVLVNTLCGTITNIANGIKFSWKKLFAGLGKALTFYISCAAVALAFTMLPFVNEMISKTFNIILFSNDVLETFSTAGVFGVILASITAQGKKALEGITELANVKIANKEDK